MASKTIPQKFMRPREYGPSRGMSWRSCYTYIDRGVIPAYRFQGLVLIDVEEADAILKGLVRHTPKPMKRFSKAVPLKKAHAK